MQQLLLLLLPWQRRSPHCVLLVSLLLSLLLLPLSSRIILLLLQAEQVLPLQCPPCRLLPRGPSPLGRQWHAGGGGGCTTGRLTIASAAWGCDT